MPFVAEPIEGYENIPGAGGKSPGDAAFSIAQLPVEVQRTAIPAICDRLERARQFDTMPLVIPLLSAAFQQRDDPLTELNDLQRHVLSRMVNTTEMWSIGDVHRWLKAYGLPRDRKACAQLVGVTVMPDEAMDSLHSGLSLADINHLAKSRERILKALELDPTVFERAVCRMSAGCFAPKLSPKPIQRRAIIAYRRATSINPAVANRITPTWRLADLLKEKM